MTIRTDSKGQIITRANQLMAGTAKHLTGTTQVALLGASFTPAEITAKLQSLVTLRTDVNNAKASTKAKIAQETASIPALRTFMSAFVTSLKAAYGGSPDVLADFGIAPKARAPLTAEAKVAAAAKRKATRAARHTMGTTQKKTVKGDVTGVKLTPITSPATPAVPTAPAPSSVLPSPAATNASPAPALAPQPPGTASASPVTAPTGH